MSVNEKQLIFVYNDEGAGPRSVASAFDSLVRDLSPSHQVVKCGASDIIDNNILQQNVKMLVMPGGADLPYCQKLNGQGNKNIRDFVEGGGSYLGLCAGGYYACQKIEFETGSCLEVVGDRELGFFQGIARGSIVPGFEYQTENGAAACRIEFSTLGKQEKETCEDYVNGGPGFYPYTDDYGEAIGRFCNFPDNPIAAVRCPVGKGVALLTSSHPELGVEYLQKYLEELNLNIEQRQKVEQICDSLAKNEQQRRDFWHTLLMNANLGEWINKD